MIFIAAQKQTEKSAKEEGPEVAFFQLFSRRTFVLCSSTIADIAGYRIMARCRLDKLVAEIELVAADSLVVVRRSEFVPT